MLSTLTYQTVRSKHTSHVVLLRKIYDITERVLINLAKVRIAVLLFVADAKWIRPILTTHLINSSLGPRESAPPQKAC